MIWKLLMVLGILGVDQVVKYWCVNFVQFMSPQPEIAGFFRITYVENRGIAFGMFQGSQWIVGVLTVLAVLLICWVLWKKLISHPMGVWSLVAVLGGALGNLIDRLLRGFVVDMFEPLFVRFAVFNVADAFLVCGGIVFAVYLVFFYGKEEKHAAKS